MGAASFRWILQLHKDVPKAAKLYSEGLDFSINVCTLRWAELQSGSLKLALLHSPRLFIGSTEKRTDFTLDLEHAMQKGYSSLLSFTVTDINSTGDKANGFGCRAGWATHKGNEPRLQQSGVSMDTWWASMSPPEGMAKVGSSDGDDINRNNGLSGKSCFTDYIFELIVELSLILAHQIFDKLELP
ncbi:hypothetical protein HYC85_015247 [Camellia sinensis]|uniref:Uncharacterized protein n=1 Tax=Camellia sinensis TaxID=4442 RepID=A0A7J7GW87_CAMSI|nr:hypothetical protein HYC85_015247 [Camellia sinensis]